MISWLMIGRLKENDMHGCSLSGEKKDGMSDYFSTFID